MTLAILVLVVLAAVLFFLAGFNVGPPRFNLAALGLCALALAYLIQHKQ